MIDDSAARAKARARDRFLIRAEAERRVRKPSIAELTGARCPRAEAWDVMMEGRRLGWLRQRLAGMHAGRRLL
jgi:hypothetical protein